MQFMRTWSAAPVACTAAASGSLLHTQTRGLKPKKKPKIGAKYIKEAQPWREGWNKERQKLLVDSIRGYISYSSTQRQAPYDNRFAPFDRSEKDGVYIIMKHMMDDKLALSNNHAPAVKRLFCNVGLLGPQVTTTARWKPSHAASLRAKATKLEEFWTKDKSIRAKWFKD
jgi:hypothetical protein